MTTGRTCDDERFTAPSLIHEFAPPLINGLARVILHAHRNQTMSRLWLVRSFLRWRVGGGHGDTALVGTFIGRDNPRRPMSRP